jgi:hypothetical protein
MKITVFWDVTFYSQNILMKETASCSEMLEPFYQISRHHIPEYNNFIITAMRTYDLADSFMFLLVKGISGTPQSRIMV